MFRVQGFRVQGLSNGQCNYLASRVFAGREWLRAADLRFRIEDFRVYPEAQGQSQALIVVNYSPVIILLKDLEDP